MSNVIFKEFYTYQIVDGDLVVYTWRFTEDWGSELAYYNRATNQVTYVESHSDPDKFCEINDVFLSRIAAVVDSEGYEDFTIEVDVDEIIDDEGLAFFAKLRDEHLEDETFDKDSGAFETNEDEEKE
jgi:hypothetical protein